MNIKELIEWRPDCFFCHEELSIFPVIGGATAGFSINNNYFRIKSKFLNFQVHIETGEVVDLQEDDITTNDLINKTQLKITCKCLSCKENGYLYEYSGSMSLSPMLNKQLFTFREKVAVANKWLFSQVRNCNGQWGIIKTFRKNDDIQPPKSKYELVGDYITTPFFDLKKITPEKLEHRLKTYIVFS